MSLRDQDHPTALQRDAAAVFNFDVSGRTLAAGGALRQYCLAGSPANALTLIDLRNNYAKQTFYTPEPPLGLAFGSDNRAP